MKVSIYEIKQVVAKVKEVPDVRITSSAIIVDVIRTVTGAHESDREQFGIICVNTKHDITGVHTVSIGDLSSSLVHPREVFKMAILNNSSSIFLYHNHPSGDVTPSAEDREVTSRLAEAGKVLGIKVIDHVIVSPDTYYSFMAEGEL